MKKRILIVSHAMEIGGAERALLGLLDNLDYSLYDVDLFLMRQEGELFSFINPAVNLLPVIKEYTLLDAPIKSVFKEKKYAICIGRLFGKFKASRYVKKNKFQDPYSVAIEYSHKYVKNFLPEINPLVEYDLAISFLTPHYCVTEKVFAKKRIAWIHTDYATCDIDRDSELKMWSPYNHIISISDSVTDSFLKKFPELSEKIIKIENALPTTLIRNQSIQVIDDDIYFKEKDCIKLLSIGRFCSPKNFDNIPAIAKQLKKMGHNIKWYIIGFGIDEELILSRIQSENVSESVIVLGKRVNPYPYILNCDLYVQPSRYEGKAVTVCEAQFLNKPVVITNYATAASQVEHGVDGIIVSLDNKLCAQGISRVLSNSELLNMLSENCKKRDYSNSLECNKLKECF